MSLEAPSLAAAVSGLVRSDPHGPGLTRARDGEGFRFYGPSGAEITDEETRQRIRALRIPPAWENVWISADPLGHIQATGVDSKGRTQYLYHPLWREQRDAQKFGHMLQFAKALPGQRTAAEHDLRRRRLNRDRGRRSAGRIRTGSLTRPYLRVLHLTCTCLASGLHVCLITCADGYGGSSHEADGQRWARGASLGNGRARNRAWRSGVRCRPPGVERGD